ncbi:MAG: serine/threonine-protein kinase [Synechocystis sp.]|nr:serine/threonine-protein kinase [Synechocystis sp.]
MLLRERYQALQLLGQGGFGKTFIAVDHDKPSKPQCVIKQCSPQLEGSDGAAKAEVLFAEEAKHLEQLGHHDQIPALYAHFTLDGQQYLVQEYVRGQTLTQELETDGVFNQAKIEQVLQDLLPVLDFIHRIPVIHRDIKPDNIIRRESDHRLVLVDFGAAKRVISDATGTIIGTPEYVAPEQMAGKPKEASDIYSLGVTCLHLLTGVSPFELFDTGEFAWVWRDFLVDNSVDNRFGLVLDKMVCQGTKNRYQSVKEVLQDLKPSKTYNSFSKLYKLASDNYKEGRYREAQRYIKQVEVLYPNDPNGLLLHGHILLALKQYVDAKNKYEKVISYSDRPDLIDCARDSIRIIEERLGKLSNLDLAKIMSLAAYLEDMHQKVLKYHNDHNASYEEAKIISEHYLLTAKSIKNIKTKEDLINGILKVEDLKLMTMRFQHKKEKYRWGENLENYVIASLKYIQSNPAPNFFIVQSNSNSSSKKLSQLDLAGISSLGSYFNEMGEKIKKYYYDHKASPEEAEILAQYYLNTSRYLKTVKNLDNLTQAIQNIEALKIIIARYQHKKEKYRWDLSLERNVLEKLRVIKLDNVAKISHFSKPIQHTSKKKATLQQTPLKSNNSNKDLYLAQCSLPTNLAVTLLLGFFGSYCHTKRWGGLFFSTVLFFTLQVISEGNFTLALASTSLWSAFDNNMAIISARTKSERK